ncbi:DUF1345 domain-containing protein [Aminobacter aganoensis]|uniref:Putative membrane protein n=1 Tax=Aminobacter aganoensis TaxID=83264 RepID=A0A7X0F806_9HYPH|nr:MULTISPECIES: DUF1345 domain-containing protein [Aminobacter]KQU75881.1 hypothetical protein ASC75_17850 [Aminobacter sp. DSM 101952]MBB6354740.1 putative membrane protein [Aminobacter aganoensis]
MKPFGRHFIFLASAGIGLVALVAALLFHHPLSYSIAANAFFACYIFLVLREMPRLTADFLSRRAQQADEPIWIIFLVTIGIVVVAVGSLFILINAKQVPHAYWLAFSLLSLPLGWLTIHAMAALHYARLYWKGDSKADATSTRSRKPVGGLIFPGTERPCGWDFLYFAVVIGMTAQTADTNISSTHMRQAALVHSILSFFFNTIIVAAAVNLVVSLAS